MSNVLLLFWLTCPQASHTIVNYLISGDCWSLCIWIHRPRENPSGLVTLGNIWTLHCCSLSVNYNISHSMFCVLSDSWTTRKSNFTECQQLFYSFSYPLCIKSNLEYRNIFPLITLTGDYFCYFLHKGAIFSRKVICDKLFGGPGLFHIQSKLWAATLISGQLYLRPPCQNPVWTLVHTNSVFTHSRKRPAPLVDTFSASRGCPLTGASAVF